MLNLFINRFKFYKDLGDKTIAQLAEENFFWKYNEDSNSIAVLIQHLSGNMISRFTNFLTEDGEKANRNRDGEFESSAKSKEELIDLWEKGWNCLFDALQALREEDLTKVVQINKASFSVAEALFKALTHYSYHVGQLIYIAKMQKGATWQTLSIPKKKKSGTPEPERNDNASPVCYANSKEVRDEYKNP